MGLEQFLLLIIIVGGIYWATRQLVRWAVRRGVPTQIYLRFIYPRRMALAYAKGDISSAERQVYGAYLAQLTAQKESDRELAVQYLEQLPASAELVDRLIEALPQQATRALQLRLAQLLQSALSDLEHSSSAAQKNFESGLPDWSRAISVWLTIIFVVALSWRWWTQLGAIYFLVATAAILGMALWALTWVISDRKLFIRLSGLIVGLTLAGLWAFSDYNHTGLDSTPRRSLAAYGLGPTEVQITYPRWLTMADVNQCSDEVTLTVFGGSPSSVNPIELSLLYDHANLFVGDKNCQAIIPSFNLDASNPAGTPYQFYVMLPRPDVLAKGQIAITPQVRDSMHNGPPYPATNLEFSIQLEDPVWQVIRSIGQILFGATGVSSFVVGLYAWYRQRR